MRKIKQLYKNIEDFRFARIHQIKIIYKQQENPQNSLELSSFFSVVFRISSRFKYTWTYKNMTFISVGFNGAVLRFVRDFGYNTFCADKACIYCSLWIYKRIITTSKVKKEMKTKHKYSKLVEIGCTCHTWRRYRAN